MDKKDNKTRSEFMGNKVYRFISVLIFAISSYPFAYVFEAWGLSRFWGLLLSALLCFLPLFIPATAFLIFLQAPATLFFSIWAFVDCLIKHGMADVETIILLVILVLSPILIIVRKALPIILLKNDDKE